MAIRKKTFQRYLGALAELGMASTSQLMERLVVKDREWFKKQLNEIASEGLAEAREDRALEPNGQELWCLTWDGWRWHRANQNTSETSYGVAIAALRDVGEMPPTHGLDCLTAVQKRDRARKAIDYIQRGKR